ncbi:cobalt-zinc-cadmium efflux system membrane fusion protein [Pedobacter sp. CAN_A7]|uniref:efflux RND transporter periplasmic adaptor subunit n=1 Tax=Pedobacter sp. CAN_A7 TaxID=2787722 RepID=UPI0018C9B559
MKFCINTLYTLLICVAVYGCGTDAKPVAKNIPATADETLVQLSPEQAKQINLQLEEVKPRKMSSILKLSGQIDVPPQNLVSISIPLGGYLKFTKMLPGTQVKKGQLLGVFEDAQYIQLQQEYLSAKNKLSYASKEYDRQKALNQSKASSDKVLQQAENEYRNLNIESKGLAEKLRLIGLNPGKLNENNIGRTINVYSPIDGFVSKVNVNIGKYVTPSDVIFELVNPSDIHLSMIVFEKDLPKIGIGQRVMAFSNANPQKKYRTEVILVSHSLNSERNTEVHCHFEDYDKSLVPGMYMNAEVELNSVEQDALPNEAIVNFENRDYVFVETGKNTYQMTEVKKGKTEEGFSAVEESLKGKKMVVKGAYSLLMKLKNTVEE